MLNRIVGEPWGVTAWEKALQDKIKRARNELQRYRP
jgi:hypothetical protein